VVWVGLRDFNDILLRFQQAVENACHEFTAEPAEKRFSGHITLGRIKAINRHEAEALAKVAAALAGQFLGEWTAESVDLVRSELAQAGARHHTLAVIPLTGRQP
jgi:2'-5' RNA ligase